MAQMIGEEIVIEGTLVHNGGTLFFKGAGLQSFLLPFVVKKIAHLTFDSTPALLKYRASFITKYENENHVVNMKKNKDFEIKDISIELPELNFILENCNLFVTQSETFIDLSEAGINEALRSGRFDEILNQEDTPYTVAEDQLALQIYLTTKGSNYGDMLALIEEKIRSGEFKRSKDSVEMRVNTYKQLDADSGLKGLKPKEQSIRVWEAYKKSINSLDAKE